MKLPPDLEPLALPGAEAFARADALSWVQPVLEAGRTLHQAAMSDPGARTLRGRGPVPVVPAPDGAWVVRHYWRGGAMAPLLGDRYLRMGVPRPVSEAHWAWEAERRGIPTPRVVAGAVYPAGAFYRADIVTEYVPRSRDLAAVLFGGGEAGPDAADPASTDAAAGVPDHAAWEELRVAALEAAADLIILAAEARLFHPDLNAMNILLSQEGGDIAAWLVDLDRCRLDVAGPDLVEGAMVRRLERSLEKLGTATGRPLTREDWARLRNRLSPRVGEGRER